MTIKELYESAEKYNVENYTLNIWIHDVENRDTFYRKIEDDFEIDDSSKEFDLFVEI